MAGPDISAAKAAYEAAMDDRCAIYVDPEGFHDDRFDTGTGTWVRHEDDAADAATVYDGPCIVGKAAAGDSLESGRPEGVVTKTVKIKLGYDIPAGAVVEVTKSKRNAAIVGDQYRVIGSDGGTYSVANVLTCEHRTPSVRGRHNE